MDIFAAIKDDKSKENLEKLMNGEEINNGKSLKKKMKKNNKTNNDRVRGGAHFEEYHFKTGDEFLNHIKSGKKAYRGGERGWITIDKNDRNMVVSYQMQENTGKMGFSYESVEVFKAVIEQLDKNKVYGYIDFWHKKPFEKKKVDVKSEESDN